MFDAPTGPIQVGRAMAVNYRLGRLLLLVPTVLLFVGPTQTALAKPGDTKLVRILETPGKPAQYNKVLPLPDGSQFFAGRAGTTCLVHREKNGEAMPGFPRFLAFGGTAPKNFATCRSARLFGSDRILLVGTARAAVDLSDGDGLLAVVDFNGVLDKAFGNGGYKLFGGANSDDRFYDAVVLPAAVLEAGGGTHFASGSRGFVNYAAATNNESIIFVTGTSFGKDLEAVGVWTVDQLLALKKKASLPVKNLDHSDDNNHHFRVNPLDRSLVFPFITRTPQGDLGSIVANFDLVKGKFNPQYGKSGGAAVLNVVAKGEAVRHGLSSFLVGSSGDKAAMLSMNPFGVLILEVLARYDNADTSAMDLLSNPDRVDFFYRVIAVAGEGSSIDAVNSKGELRTNFANGGRSKILESGFHGREMEFFLELNRPFKFSHDEPDLASVERSPSHIEDPNDSVTGAQAAITFGASDLVVAGYAAAAGISIAQAAYAVVEGLGPDQSKCVASSSKLCLNQGRFEVTAGQTSGDVLEPAKAVGLTPDTGYFWFFSQNNVEVVVKVINGCGPFERFWVFAAGLTNVGVELRVRDTKTGEVQEYVNTIGRAFPPLQDTSAFATCNALSAPALQPLLVFSPQPGGPTGSARHDERWTRIAPAAATTVQLAGGRFKVEATFQAPGAAATTANAVKLTGDTAYLWFFDDKNVEVVFKVINACGSFLNNRFWFFAAGLTNVQVDITVTDTKSAQKKTFSNAQGTPFAAIQNTNAFACP